MPARDLDASRSLASAVPPGTPSCGPRAGSARGEKGTAGLAASLGKAAVAIAGWGVVSLFGVLGMRASAGEPPQPTPMAQPAPVELPTPIAMSSRRPLPSAEEIVVTARRLPEPRS